MRSPRVTAALSSHIIPRVRARPFKIWSRGFRPLRRSLLSNQFACSTRETFRRDAREGVSEDARGDSNPLSEFVAIGGDNRKGVFSSELPSNIALEYCSEMVVDCMLVPVTNTNGDQDGASSLITERPETQLMT